VSPEPLSSEMAKALQAYEEEVVSTFEPALSEDGRLDQPHTLIDRFREAVRAMLKTGPSSFGSVQGAHNELCIARVLLQYRFSEIHYEPPLEGTEKTIDFRASGDATVFIDVKTIRPDAKDAWDKFQEAVRKGFLPENLKMSLSQKWLGGEIWHDMFAARTRFAEHTSELEEKIESGRLSQETPVVLVLCSDGFRWHEDQLEDFVAFYRSGSHLPGDPFSKMELYDMKARGVSFNGTIASFAYMERRSLEVNHRRLNWDVRPPAGYRFIPVGKKKPTA